MAVDGLKRFFKGPLQYDKASGHGVFLDPIWWFRGARSSTYIKISKFREWEKYY